MVFSLSNSIGGNYIYYIYRLYDANSPHQYGHFRYTLDKPARSMFISNSVGYNQGDTFDPPKFMMIVANIGDGPRDGEDFH